MCLIVSSVTAQVFNCILCFNNSCNYVVFIQYLSLMKELGEVVPGAENSTAKSISTNPILSGTAVPPPASLVML